MKNNIKFVSMVSLLSLVTGVAGAAVVTKTDCEKLGYTTPLEKCTPDKGTALFCPFFNAKDKPLVLCYSKSCRGYPLKEEEFSQKASDGNMMTYHIKDFPENGTFVPKQTDSQGILGCFAGYENDSDGKLKEIWYYKIKECKENSLYQNNICDVGCLAERYPYDSHQGNIAGDMRRCDDSKGEHYGYETCNDGWEGGWQKTKNTANPTGKCELATCSVQNFPYMSDPNTHGFNRGITKQCLVGGNPYYQYSATDLMGEPSPEACGVGTYNSYTLVGPVCQNKCIFSGCIKTKINKTLSGINFSYNEWTCTLDNKSDCRLGDEAFVKIGADNIDIGVVTHLPTDESDYVRVLSMKGLYNYGSYGVFAEDSVPLPQTDCDTNAIGKYNTNFLVAYETEKNKTAEPGYEYSFPISHDLLNYAPSDCSAGSVCGRGEWASVTCMEGKQMYNDRAILYNVTKSKIGTALWSSNIMTESNRSGRYNYAMLMTGAGTYGLYNHNRRYLQNTYYPMLTFKLSNP